MAEVMCLNRHERLVKTKEPAASEWVSKFIGRSRSNGYARHFDGSRAGRNFALDRQIEPL